MVIKNNYFKISLLALSVLMLLLVCFCITSNSQERHLKSTEVDVFKDVHRFSVNHNDQRLQAVRFIKYRDSSIKIPILMRQHPRFGIFRVYKEVRAEDIISFIGPNQEYIYLPVSNEISSYIFLFRELGNFTETPWYFLEISSENLEFDDHSNISLPRINSLPLLADIANEQYYLHLLSLAEEEYKKLREMQK